jgi:DNA-binding CsgD family transcriptional regulator
MTAPTRREIQVAEMTSRGLRHKEIAFELGVTIKTVRSFARTLADKLDTHNATHAYRRLLELGFIHIDEVDGKDSIEGLVRQIVRETLAHLTVRLTVPSRQLTGCTDGLRDNARVTVS